MRDAASLVLGCSHERRRPCREPRREPSRNPGQDRFDRVRRGAGGDRRGRAADRRGHPPGAHRPARLPQADRERELRLAGRAAHDGHLVLATSTPRARSVTASTPAARTSTRSRRSPPSTPASCSVRRYAYVQPHSGIDANLVAFWSILAHHVETPALATARRQERQRAERGRLGDAAPRVRQPAAARHVARRGWPPDPRLPPQHQRQDVPPAAVRHRPRDRAARLRRGARPRRRSSSRWS